MPTKKPSGTPSAANSRSKPPEPLTLFLDESLDSDSIAQALAAAGATVERLTRHLPKGTDDGTWLSFAGARDWVHQHGAVLRARHLAAIHALDDRLHQLLGELFACARYCAR